MTGILIWEKVRSGTRLTCLWAENSRLLTLWTRICLESRVSDKLVGSVGLGPQPRGQRPARLVIYVRM